MTERFIGWFCLDMPATPENLFSCRRVEPFATGETRRMAGSCNSFCRELFTSLGFAYDDIRHCDLDALQGYIAIECARSHRAGMTPHFMTPRRKSDSLCCKMKPEGGLEKAYIKIDCLDQWNGREAISFNSDGFIGFCGWADTQNSQPFLNAFRRWLTEYMLERSR